jgi:hypothetical protein
VSVAGNEKRTPSYALSIRSLARRMADSVTDSIRETRTPAALGFSAQQAAPSVGSSALSVYGEEIRREAKPQAKPAPRLVVTTRQALRMSVPLGIVLAGNAPMR